MIFQYRFLFHYVSERFIEPVIDRRHKEFDRRNMTVVIEDDFLSSRRSLNNDFASVLIGNLLNNWNLKNCVSPHFQCVSRHFHVLDGISSVSGGVFSVSGGVSER